MYELQCKGVQSYINAFCVFELSKLHVIRDNFLAALKWLKISIVLKLDTWSNC